MISRRTLLTAFAALSVRSWPTARVLGEPRGAHALIRDLMPAFWATFEPTRNLPDPHQRATAFGQQFLLPHAEIFTSAGFNGGSHGRFWDDRVAQWLIEFDMIALAVKRLSQLAPGGWLASERRFSERFPDYRPTASVWFIVSLFSFDGYTQAWDGRQRLFFGVDGIVRQHGSNADLAILFSHELFHLYHASVTKPGLDVETVGMRMWREGLATYASQILNPGSNVSQLLLDQAALNDPVVISRVAAEALAKLASSEPAELNRLFDMGYIGNVPARMGYVLGYRVVEAAARIRQLDELVALPADEVRSLIAQHLRQLAGQV